MHASTTSSEGSSTGVVEAEDVAMTVDVVDVVVKIGADRTEAETPPPPKAGPAPPPEDDPIGTGDIVFAADVEAELELMVICEEGVGDDEIEDEEITGPEIGELVKDAGGTEIAGGASGAPDAVNATLEAMDVAVAVELDGFATVTLF